MENKKPFLPGLSALGGIRGSSPGRTASKG